MYVVQEKTEQLEVYEISMADGKLHFLESISSDNRPVFVDFLQKSPVTSKAKKKSSG